ncbi:F420-non-reducing hydrogenase iron-sulfur subunit D [Methanocella paludicola SANAE]|uniref:F420-non-reducing hydrogenase iron-sulfur subunit D n=1 Tax=Methanocella paludicola (strain DSM 17711 / JCM 13418 / NBRC 101707 / SANAE) TaxID=304371 RepID=D1Z2B7_METPS|nr:hydrogenase iron-sulfur subunit [Methanocella paludicola]BAI62839.1 F420-non-reducing hydrogenase iron-sulfur subunit D [Methanocella paludicola SANAE]
MADEFEPKILGILCNWCTYAGSDLAGTSRIQYPPNVRVIRVMCTGRIDPAFVMEAFSLGADAVLISGCHIGDCHYIAGNYKARRRIALTRKVIEQFGIDPRRLKMTFVSASEGALWAEVVKDMVNTVKKLGPTPVQKKADLHEAGHAPAGADDDLAEIAKASAGVKLEAAPVQKK